MNKIAEKIQHEYREMRYLSNYSIFDIESSLIRLAERGFVWVLKDMKDMSEFEKILIEHYLEKFRPNQIYDNLEDTFYLQFKKAVSTLEPTKWRCHQIHSTNTSEPTYQNSIFNNNLI